MKEERFFYVPNAADSHELPDDEAQHASRVLRLSEGDEVFLMDGKGCFFRATLSLVSRKHCLYDINEPLPQQKSWKGNLHLAIAPTKMMERIEWMVEKATEIGFDEITFLDCKFSERKTIRTDRIERIVVSAMKQSRKPFKPIVNTMTSFADFIKNNVISDKDNTCRHGYIAHCYEEIRRNYLFEELRKIPQDSDIIVLVGPEGDFSLDEVSLAMQNGFEPVSLGASRLRTETAGLMAVTMAQLSKNC